MDNIVSATIMGNVNGGDCDDSVLLLVEIIIDLNGGIRNDVVFWNVQFCTTRLEYRVLPPLPEIFTPGVMRHRVIPALGECIV